jgi:hypothetical protein
MLNDTSTEDGFRVGIGIEDDPGRSGKADELLYFRSQFGFDVVINSVHEFKRVRRQVSVRAEAGKIKIVQSA